MKVSVGVYIDYVLNMHVPNVYTSFIKKIVKKFNYGRQVRRYGTKCITSMYGIIWYNLRYRLFAPGDSYSGHFVNIHKKGR